MAKSRGLRIFLVCWAIFSVHFATNVVREHYPAFSIVADGDLKLDEYEGFHSDIFVHQDGHAYVGNQIAGSLPAVPALMIFDPLLDRLEEKRLKELRDNPKPAATHDETEYNNRAKFLNIVKARGLDLRFGAATVVTSVFCMAPLSALFVVLMFGIMKKRGIPERRAAGLSLLFAFATPLFYRTAHLNHNVFLMMTVFLLYWLIWSEKEDQSLSAWRLIGAGLCAGLSLALDYAGAVPLLFFYFFWGISRARHCGWLKAIGESMLYVLGTLPSVVFLWWSQWTMYGDPFLPGQKHMPDVNFTDRGWRGIDWPSLDLLRENFLSLNYGLLPFGPLLILGFLPAFFYRRAPLVVDRMRRLSAWGFITIFLLFCAANQYSYMQFNSGFRYLLPVVPLLFLLSADHLNRIPAALLWLLAIPALLHGWVLSMVRYTTLDLYEGVAAVPECWRRVLAQGLQLPWLTRFQQTVADQSHFLHWRIWPFTVVLITALFCAVAWNIRLNKHSTSLSVEESTGD